MIRPAKRHKSLPPRLPGQLKKLCGNFEGDLDKDFYGNVTTPYEQINRKVIVPSEEELVINSRARSAKLRIGKKL